MLSNIVCNESSLILINILYKLLIRAPLFGRLIVLVCMYIRSTVHMTVRNNLSGVYLFSPLSNLAHTLPLQCPFGKECVVTLNQISRDMCTRLRFYSTNWKILVRIIHSLSIQFISCFTYRVTMVKRCALTDYDLSRSNLKVISTHTSFFRAHKLSF